MLVLFRKQSPNFRAIVSWAMPFVSWLMLVLPITGLMVAARWATDVRSYSMGVALLLLALCTSFYLESPESGRSRLLAALAACIACFAGYYVAGDHFDHYPSYVLPLAAFAFYFAWPDAAASLLTYGSAEWASLSYLRERGLVGIKGFRLGCALGGAVDDVLRYAGDKHLFTVAPTRGGKGVSSIIPNLLTYRGSTLVIDPKGENAMITAEAREAMGQAIHIVDPWGITLCGKPSRFNPLDWLEPGDIDMTENAMLLADALIVPQSGGEQFWREEAKALLQGFILYVATDAREAHRRHLGRVRDLLLLSGTEMQKLFERMAESPHHVVASTGTRSLQKEERLLANVLASAQAETHFLDSGRMRESLSASDFSFADLKRHPTTIYLVLPADRLNAFARWLRLLIQQAITVNARDIGAKPRESVLFMLDELPALGRLSMVEQAFGLMAGFGMQMWGIAQDLSQLKRIYGESWESFISNAGAVQYFGSRDRMTAEYFSALCGVATVTTTSTSFNRGGNSSSTTTTTAPVQRKLAFTDELMRIDTHRQLVFIENHPPIFAVKVPWFNDPELAKLGTPYITVCE